MLSRNGANWPESETTRAFRSVRQVTTPRGRSLPSATASGGRWHVER